MGILFFLNRTQAKEASVLAWQMLVNSEFTVKFLPLLLQLWSPTAVYIVLF